MFNLIGDCCGYLLAMRNRFAIAAGAPVANGILGAALLAAWPEGGLLNLIAGTVLGVALHASALQFLVIAGATAILARFSDLVAQRDTTALRSILLKSGIASAGVGLCAIAAVWAVGALAAADHRLAFRHVWKHICKIVAGTKTAATHLEDRERVRNASDKNMQRVY